MILYDARGRPVTLDRRIGGGGEGDVYLVAGQPGWVAKIYAKPTPRIRDKLAWMIDHPPDARQDSSGHTTLAWPVGMLYADRGGTTFSGFLMPHVAGAVPLLQVFNPRLRARTLPAFDRRYLARTARNLAAVLATLHRSGYVVGDLNESNILVTPSALVAVIDCDSFQVQARRGGRVITDPCPVGKLEYTAPELQGKPFGREVRRPEADRFALGVLVFQLLMEGRHPFSGAWTGSGEPPAVEEKIRRGCFPYAERPVCPILPPPNAPPLDTLPAAVADLMRRCFVAGHRDPSRRPTPEAWRDTLAHTEGMVGKAAPKRPTVPPVTAPPVAGAVSQARTDAPAPPARPPHARAAIAKRHPAPATTRRASRGGRMRDIMATIAGILLIVTLTVGGGWWLLNHYALLPLAPPGATPGVGSGSSRGVVQATPATSVAAANACTPRTAAAAAATAAAVPRAAYTPLAGSWVASAQPLHIRFYGMPWWDERPALSRGGRYAVGYVPEGGDFDALDVLRVAGASGPASAATWQSELDAYTHRSAGAPGGAVNTATISGVVVTSRPRPMKVSGYDGYLGQFHFTEDGSRLVDATLWVGQVGCDRVTLVFAGTPARDRQIDQAVTQVLATLDFSAQ